MERRERFWAVLQLRNLLEMNISKESIKSLRTAKEALMLINAVLDNFDCFYLLGDSSNVYLTVDEKKKITGIKIGA